MLFDTKPSLKHKSLSRLKKPSRLPGIQDVDTCFVKLKVTVSNKKKKYFYELNSEKKNRQLLWNSYDYIYLFISYCKIFIQLFNNEIRRRLKLYLIGFIQ